MNSVLKKALILGSIGFAIGLAIGITIFFLTGGSVEVITGRIVFEFLVGGIYGGLAMGGSAVYDIEEWSIARSTATHFICTFIGFFVLAYLQGWLMPGELLFWIFVVMWIFAYFMIWLIQYLVYHRKINEMNEELKNIRNR